MDQSQEFRRKRDEALDRAAACADWGERSRLLSEAAAWHQQVLRLEQTQQAAKSA